MKKVLLVGAVALMGAVSVNAQAKFGVKAGYALSTVNVENAGEDAPSFDSKSTFYIGGMAEYSVADKMAVQAELLYSPLGAKTSLKREVGPYYVEATQKLNLGTLAVPVSFKYYATPEFALNAGVNFGIILSAKTNSEVDHNLPTELANAMGEDFETGEVDIKDDVNTLNLAPFIGAEYNLSNGLFVDARYNLGVSNLIKDADDDEKITNSSLMVGLGFKF